MHVDCDIAILYSPFNSNSYFFYPSFLKRSLERIARAGKEPSFVEFDYSKTGSAWLHIPPSSMRLSSSHQVFFILFDFLILNLN